MISFFFGLIIGAVLTDLATNGKESITKKLVTILIKKISKH